MNDLELSLATVDTTPADPAGSSLISAALDSGRHALAAKVISAALQCGHTVRLPERHRPFLSALKHAHWRRWGELLRVAANMKEHEIAALESHFIVAMKKAPLRSVMRFQTELPAITEAQYARLAASELPLWASYAGLAQYRLRTSAFEHDAPLSLN